VVPLILSVFPPAIIISHPTKWESGFGVVFRWGAQSYEGSTAVAVVRAIEREQPDYPNREGSLRQFLQWSLDRLEAHIPMRELFVDVQVGDETLALSYLLLLEQYGLGALEGDTGSRYSPLRH
jgi:hypothetical protein